MQKRNQPTALVDNTAKFKTTNLQRALAAITIVAGVGVVAFPESASATAASSTAVNVYTSGGLNSTNNSSQSTTGGGTASDNAYATATQGSTGNTSTNATGMTAAVSSDTPNADANAGGMADEEVNAELKACAAAMNDMIGQNQKEEVGIVIAGTGATDTIYNTNTAMGEKANDATSGCFTAGQDIINLATLIPSVQTSWRGTIGNVIKEQLTKRATQLKDGLLQRGCKIANDAVAKALEPIEGYLKTADRMSAVVNNPEDFLGEYLASKIDVEFDRTDLAFNQTLDDIQARVDSDVAEASSKLGSANTSYAQLFSEDPAAQAALDKAIEQQNQANNAAIAAAQNGSTQPTPTPEPQYPAGGNDNWFGIDLSWLNSFSSSPTSMTGTTTNNVTAPTTNTTVQSPAPSTSTNVANTNTTAATNNLYSSTGTTTTSNNMYAR